MIKVWDLWVRGFHWLLVLSVSLAALTGFLLDATWIDLHVWSGTLIAALLLSRVIWGFLGPTHARFSDFVSGPRTWIHHLRELKAGTARRHLGHNPLGGVMMLALMLSLAALVVTGALIFGGVFKAGPAGFLMSYDLGHQFTELHESIAVFLLLLIGAHLGGALFESIRSRENLPRAMVTGQKEARAGDQPSPQVHARLGMALFLTTLVLALGTLSINKLASLPVAGMPFTTLDPVYADECTACHMAYHPSLMSGENWRLLMASLDDHFGEDASLSEATTTQLTEWLAQHSAETTDSKPAHVFRKTAKDAPFTVSKSPFWKKRHKGIDDAVFTAKPVFSRANCAACHADAETGRFYPGNISIPKETRK